jgi:hypothetical protein
MTKEPVELTDDFIKEKGLNITKSRPQFKAASFKITTAVGVGIGKPFKESGVKIHIKT